LMQKNGSPKCGVVPQIYLFFFKMLISVSAR
jgi:hypothetical protein